ncbi:hypothetical protein SBFV2_gp31 [Sulfolobales Beppu filamentous virus 2]|uniref:Uncharacterized protein n=1 Tax=Sulfolobales Beppu filamentous virus 2 TaxID=2493123 RepID=A0A3Q8Q3S2_9VIRU|nr:hypothetical protein HOU84_gp31 [Sulfolobales Beppu filamentous virus 2]AZI75798.1 hypothetical protein SBFV2_gp31 [Sulfolobales Beppu filamentous virus 2]
MRFWYHELYLYIRSLTCICGRPMDKPDETKAKRSVKRDKEEGSESANDADRRLDNRDSRPGVVDEEDEGGSETSVGAEDEGISVHPELSQSEGGGSGNRESDRSDDAGGREEAERVRDTVSRFINMEVQRKETRTVGSNNFNRILQERFGGNNTQNTTRTGTGDSDAEYGGSGGELRGQTEQQSGNQGVQSLAMQRFLQRKTGATTLDSVSVMDVVNAFRKLPLEVRLEEAIRTINEFKNIQKKWSGLLDSLATFSDKYKQAMSKKKPIDRIIDTIVDGFARYMASSMSAGVSENEKEKLRKIVEEALSENEEGL